jgi:hypothetical protein
MLGGLGIEAADLDVDRQPVPDGDGVEAGGHEAAARELGDDARQQTRFRLAEHRIAPEGIGRRNGLRKKLGHDTRSPSGTRKDEHGRPGSRREPGG